MTLEPYRTVGAGKRFGAVSMNANALVLAARTDNPHSQTGPSLIIIRQLHAKRLLFLAYDDNARRPAYASGTRGCPSEQAFDSVSVPLFRPRPSPTRGVQPDDWEEWLTTSNVDAARAMLQLFPADERAAEPAPNASDRNAATGTDVQSNSSLF